MIVDVIGFVTTYHLSVKVALEKCFPQANCSSKVLGKRIRNKFSGIGIIAIKLYQNTVEIECSEIERLAV